MNWVDSSDSARIADPAQAYQDVRRAHQWASEELAGAVGLRAVILTQERHRLASIAWQLKGRL